jgi:hypothetical protein
VTSTAYVKRRPNFRVCVGQSRVLYKLPKMCYIYHTMVKPCNTRQAAKAVGISTMTLQRWLAAGRVKGPKLRIRNGRAVRLWGKGHLAALHKVKLATYCKGRGRKKGYKRK